MEEKIMKHFLMDWYDDTDGTSSGSSDASSSDSSSSSSDKSDDTSTGVEGDAGAFEDNEDAEVIDASRSNDEPVNDPENPENSDVNEKTDEEEFPVSYGYVPAPEAPPIPVPGENHLPEDGLGRPGNLEHMPRIDSHIIPVNGEVKLEKRKKESSHDSYSGYEDNGSVQDSHGNSVDVMTDAGGGKYIENADGMRGIAINNAGLTNDKLIDFPLFQIFRK